MRHPRSAASLSTRAKPEADVLEGPDVEVAGRFVGNEIFFPPDREPREWRTSSSRSVSSAARARRQASAFLEDLESAADRCRIRTVDHGFGDESWSVRKAVRRLVSHELLHSKSIRRIIREHRAGRARVSSEHQ